MGLSPREVDRMSLWEFAACVAGFNRAHGGEDDMPAPPTADEFEALKAKYADL